VKRDQKRMRAGVVGAGHMGQYHILVYAELWDVELVGVVDVDPSVVARLAAQYDTQGFTDYRELFGKVDVVSIAVPTPLHFEVAREFMEAGIHVLIEKPLTPTLDEARELFRIARRQNVVLHVGHVERFNGAVQELRKIVVNPVLIESRRLGPFVPRVQGDTVIMDLMIHDIDIVLGLVDAEIHGLTAVGARIQSPRPDVANVQIVFENGTLANITASRATEQKIRTLAITQPDAYIFLNYSDQDIQIHRRAASEYILNRESIRYRQESFVEHLFVHKENPLKLELVHLLSAVREAQRTGRVELSEHDDVRSLGVALAIERMLSEGQAHLPWPPPKPGEAGAPGADTPGA
jgi:predicted dehydrogenase